jgi:hypothetical protein
MISSRYIRMTKESLPRNTLSLTILNLMRNSNSMHITIDIKQNFHLSKSIRQSTILQEISVQTIKTFLSLLNIFLTGWHKPKVLVMSKVFTSLVKHLLASMIYMLDLERSLLMRRWLASTERGKLKYGIVLISQAIISKETALCWCLLKTLISLTLVWLVVRKQKWWRIFGVLWISIVCFINS